jgi:putative chitinase
VILTTPVLAQVFKPTPSAVLAPYVDPLNAMFVEREVNTLNRAAALLGQLGVESQRLTRMTENLNYRDPQRLDAMFSAVRGVEDAELLITKGPMAIANRVYANRLGNGPETSGDGWRFRGCGGIQCTGRDNHAAFGASCGLGVMDVPAYLQTPKGAIEVTGWFWGMHGLNDLADQYRITDITRIVNGPALEGLNDRIALTKLARGLLALGGN